MAVTSAAAVLLSGLALGFALDHSLTNASDAAAAKRLREVIAQLAHAAPGELDRSVLATGPGLTAVQVLDQSGRVVHTSFEGPKEPLTDVRPEPEATIHDARPAVPPDHGLRLTAATTIAASGTYTIVVATNQDAIEDTIRLVATLTAVGGLFIVAIATSVTYLLIGWSLHSVERIRRRVSAITTTDLAEHVPVPTPRDEIASLATTMNDMLDRISAGHVAQQRFVSNASHELRSPLTTITTSLEMGELRPELVTADLISTVLLPEAQRMGRLVDDLLLLARADESGMTLRLTVLDLDHLIDEEVIRARSGTDKRLVTQVRPVQVTADREKLGRALRNVIDNAVRYAASRVTIELSQTHGEIVIIVRDDGPGIGLEHREKVFDRFYRIGDDRSRDSGGSGLGIPITAEIIGAHHGRIRIAGSVGTGTAVIITIPEDPNLALPSDDGKAS
ncbi:sensor histidine kinase [Smaragdicoccus niigatensis]|uniref:sensor histidine kinase n=1 Tax=Smaragdicoccus niigatensis TaxID=359359 RepID=UPI0003A06C13|nr:HAMP domain-containing sensor histidine kinase [Smaragdicoccus niigatensis]